MVNPSSNDEAIDNPLEDEGPVKVLLRLTETAGFLRSTDGSFYAQVSAAGRRETDVRRRDPRLVRNTIRTALRRSPCSRAKKAASPRWPKSPTRLTIELRRITPHLAVHGIIVNLSRRHDGRVVSFTRVRTTAQDKPDTRNPVADEEFGPELETQENP